MMQLGDNSRTVVEAAKQRLAEIEETLPNGVEVEVIYDRAGLINRTLHTVLKNLMEGGTLVIVILFLMLGNFRAGVDRCVGDSAVDDVCRQHDGCDSDQRQSDEPWCD